MQFKHSVLRVLLAGLSVGAFVLPLRGWSDNTSTMVTYFPVPYASYNSLYVKDKFDVGTSNGNFTLNLGSSEVGCPAGNKSLDVHDMYLRKVTASSSLKVNQDLRTTEAFFGNKDSSSGNINLSFGNVRIGSGLGDYVNTSVNSFTTKELYTGSFYLYPDKVSDSNLSNAECPSASWRYIDFGSNHKGYFITCCFAQGDCQDCYYDSSVTNTYKPRCEDQAPQGTWIQGNKPAGKTCGCNCPAHSSLDANGYCQCGTDYTLVDNTCVLSCSLSDYRGSHKNDCCRRSPWYTDYTDSVCWNLKWKSISGGSRTKAGSTGSCTSGSWNMADPTNTACSTPNQELTRVRDIGPCQSNQSQCCEEYHTLKCKNTINWN